MVRRGPQMERYSRFVRSLPGEYYLLREVATTLYTSGRVLRRLMRQHPGTLAPSHTAMLGKVRVYLYTPADVDRLRAHFAGAPAPAALWTAAEYTMRQRRHSAAYRAGRRAAQLAERGDAAGAKRAAELAARIKAELRSQAEARRAELRAH